MTILRGPWSRSRARWGERKRRRSQVAAFGRGRGSLFRTMREHVSAMALAALALAGIYIALEMLSPWPPLTTLRHLAAAPNCDAARAVGLAPANRGEPGYWLKHDADRDGIACEPWR